MLRRMLQLAVPVMLTQLGIMTMHLVDLLLVGRVNAVAIGAVGVGSSLFTWFMIFGMGLVVGLDYFVSHSYGSGNIEGACRSFVQGVWISAGVGFVLTLALLGLSYRLEWAGINPELIPATGPYLRALTWSLPTVLFFTACRQFLQGMGIVRPGVIILVIANVINAVVAWALIFGKFGFPALGAYGSGLATLISRILMLFMVIGVIWAWNRDGGKFFDREDAFAFDRERTRDLLKLGVPAALHMTFEVGVFAVATLLAARLSAEAMAAHQIVLNVVSVTFMVPLGISSATAVLVGQAMGRKDFVDASKNGWLGFKLGAGFMSCSALILLLFPQWILRVYTTEPGVIAVGASLLFLGGLFQVFDGVQVVGAGALRGVGDTKTAMFANLGGHWLIGLPLGALLGFKFGYGVYGLWIGLACGLVAVALLLLVRWTYVVKRRVAS